MTREDILAEVNKCVNTDRNRDYGEPEDNFKAIAGFWNCYLESKGALKTPLTSEDVAILMLLLKVARVATGGNKLDNYVDIAGYAVCGGEICSKQ